MYFIDEVRIYARGGKGGDGCSSFRREKYVPMGGPDGGDGGDGGSVILVADKTINTLLTLRFNPHVFAASGKSGSDACKTGFTADDTFVNVPLGTQVFDEEGNVLCDLDNEGFSFILVKGGAGGVGNTKFKSSTNRAPRQFTVGAEGEYGEFRLKLKILSDVGIIGLPNAGKSTFIGRCSSCKSRVGEYPFTTLRPYLGVVDLHGKIFVMADLPGLVDGASEGFGLGHRFLKHVERCKVLLHLVDSASENVVESYSCIRKELESYNPELSEKAEVVALSRCDMIEDPELILSKLEALSEFTGKEVIKIGLNISTDVVNHALIKVLMQISPVENEAEAEKFSPI